MEAALEAQIHAALRPIRSETGMTPQRRRRLTTLMRSLVDQAEFDGFVSAIRALKEMPEMVEAVHAHAKEKGLTVPAAQRLPTKEGK